jgi:hypothetical protein
MIRTPTVNTSNIKTLFLVGGISSPDSLTYWR